MGEYKLYDIAERALEGILVNEPADFKKVLIDLDQVLATRAIDLCKFSWLCEDIIPWIVNSHLNEAKEHQGYFWEGDNVNVVYLGSDLGERKLLGVVFEPQTTEILHIKTPARSITIATHTKDGNYILVRDEIATEALEAFPAMHKFDYCGCKKAFIDDQLSEVEEAVLKLLQ